MTEDELLSSVLDLARYAGWRCVHFRPTQTGRGWRTALQGDQGWPDLAMVKGHRFLLVECKSDKGKVTRDQEIWLDAVTQAGIEAFVWRPSDWTSGWIAKVLGCYEGVIRR